MAKNANEALLYAAETGCLQGVKAALDAGAAIDYAQLANEVTGTGPALFIASILGYADIVRLLLSKGASVSKRTIGSSSTPLHAAAGQGHTEVVDLLVHHGATLDTRDAFQKTPLMNACTFKRVDTVRQLIKLGARADLTDGVGYTTQRYCEFDLGREDCTQKELMKLIQEAMKTKLLRCCNPSCSKPGDRSTLKLCGRCKLTRYCSRDCQKQHWSVGHKKSCGHDVCTDKIPAASTPSLQMVKLPTGDTLLYQKVA